MEYYQNEKNILEKNLFLKFLKVNILLTKLKNIQDKTYSDISFGL